MNIQKSFLAVLSSFLFLTACGDNQEDTAVEETPDQTAELQEETTEDSDQVSDDQEEKEEETEETDKAEEDSEPDQDSEPADETNQESSQANSHPDAQWLYDELSGKSFLFSSGVGSWHTFIDFHGDGAFSAQHTDSNGEERVVTEFIGDFDIQEQIDEYTYVMYLTDLTITSETGKTEVDVDMPVTYIDMPYGFEDGSHEFHLYLPFKPKSEVPVEYMNWVQEQRNNGYDFLNSFGIYNVTHQYGMEEFFN